jgi:putative FmdB family regulatory protein
MPLYEYLCDACGRRFEIIQKFSDGPPDACRLCGKGPVQRLASSPAIQFKGTGWYVTDYGGKDKSDTSKPEGGSEKSEKKESTAKEDGAKGKDKEAKPKKAETKKSKD